MRYNSNMAINNTKSLKNKNVDKKEEPLRYQSTNTVL